MDLTLQRQACTHASYTNDHPATPHNERLEWLGDAVLQLVVSRHLYTKYPDATEAELTRRRSAMVCNEHLATMLPASIVPSVRTGGAMQATGRTRLLAGVYEALLGAAFLSGMNVDTYVQALLNAPEPLEAAANDPVSQVQQLEQKISKHTPAYTYYGDRCEVETWWGNFEGAGSNKKNARKAAAQAALDQYPEMS